MTISKASRTFLLSIVLLMVACTATQGEVPSDNVKQNMKQELIAEVAAMDYENYSAKIVHAAVAELMKLDKSDALDEIETYLAVHPEAQNSIGLFVLLRVLIEVGEDESYPPLRIGQPTLAPPANSTDLPRFPCLLVKDVPFLVVSGYSLGGMPEQVSDHIAQYRKIGVLRTQLENYPAEWPQVESEISQRWEAAYGSEVPAATLEMVRQQL